MSDVKSSLIRERNDLSGRIIKLKAFLGGDAFNILKEEDRMILIKQWVYMESYEEILAARIARL